MQPAEFHYTHIDQPVDCHFAPRERLNSTRRNLTTRLAGMR